MSIDRNIYLNIRQEEDGDFTFYDVLTGREVARMVDFKVDLGPIRPAAATLTFNMSKLDSEGEPKKYAWYSGRSRDELETEIESLKRELREREE